LKTDKINEMDALLNKMCDGCDSKCWDDDAVYPEAAHTDKECAILRMQIAFDTMIWRNDNA
jgi:hypothetical protein